MCLDNFVTLWSSSSLMTLTVDFKSYNLSLNLASISCCAWSASENCAYTWSLYSLIVLCRVDTFESIYSYMLLILLCKFSISAFTPESSYGGFCWTTTGGSYLPLLWFSSSLLSSSLSYLDIKLSSSPSSSSSSESSLYWSSSYDSCSSADSSSYVWCMLLSSSVF